jgi:hypothetical protein
VDPSPSMLDKDSVAMVGLCENVSAATNTRSSRRIVGLVVFYAVRACERKVRYSS